jgi:hypothetical protein
MAKHKKYTYPQIVKIVGYKVVNKWDTGQINLGQFIIKFLKIFMKKFKKIIQIYLKKINNN